MKFYCEHNKQFYDTAELCQAAEDAFLKAEEEKKNGEKTALAELEALATNNQEAVKKVQEAQKAANETARQFQNKLSQFSRKYGYVPEKWRSYQILNWLLN